MVSGTPVLLTHCSLFENKHTQEILKCGENKFNDRNVVFADAIKREAYMHIHTKPLLLTRQSHHNAFTRNNVRLSVVLNYSMPLYKI